MGVEIVRLKEEENHAEIVSEAAPQAEVGFHSYHVSQPEMHIWMAAVEPGTRIFPLWNFPPADEETMNLRELWSITNERSLFDCLFLSYLAKWAKPNLYAIFPGHIRIQNWDHLREADKKTFSQGQSCVYRLEGSYDGKLSINWVPFSSSQSLVKNPDFGSLWRLFGAASRKNESNSICLFGLSDPKKLPEVARILIDRENDRSVKMADLVDWFGIYSSPQEARFGSCAAIYSKKKGVVEALEAIQESLSKDIIQARNELLKELVPRTAIRIISRHVIL